MLSHEMLIMRRTIRLTGYYQTPNLSASFCQIAQGSDNP